MLERVGVSLRDAIDDVAETVQPDKPEHAASLGDGGQGEFETGKQEAAPVRRHPSFRAFANYGGTETPPLARPVSPGEEAFNPDADGSLEKPFQTDPILRCVPLPPSSVAWR